MIHWFKRGARDSSVITGPRSAYANTADCLNFLEVRCPFPSRPDNGFVNYPANPVLFYKDTATFGCHETYSLDGPEEVECSKFGNWSAQPSCKGMRYG